MKVHEAMTTSPATCEPTTSLRVVAQLMNVHDCAAIPITRNGELVGIITDRDIACRAVAKESNAPDMPVSAFMTEPVIAVGPDDPLDMAAELMSENRIHHLPVMTSEGRLVGMLAQSDLGRRMTNREFGEMARRTSIRTRPVYVHNQALTKRDH
jgi:CBS domain-containing protein